MKYALRCATLAGHHVDFVFALLRAKEKQFRAVGRPARSPVRVLAEGPLTGLARLRINEVAIGEVFLLRVVAPLLRIHEPRAIGAQGQGARQAKFREVLRFDKLLLHRRNFLCLMSEPPSRSLPPSHGGRMKDGGW